MVVGYEEGDTAVGSPEVVRKERKRAGSRRRAAVKELFQKVEFGR
jgi:hypothetical protein